MAVQALSAVLGVEVQREARECFGQAVTPPTPTEAAQKAGGIELLLALVLGCSGPVPHTAAGHSLNEARWSMYMAYQGHPFS